MFVSPVDFIFSPAGVLRQRASGCLPRSLGRACRGTWCSLSDSSSRRRGRPRWPGSRSRGWWERSEWDVSEHWALAGAGAGCCTGGTGPGSAGPSTHYRGIWKREILQIFRSAKLVIIIHIWLAELVFIIVMRMLRTSQWVSESVMFHVGMSALLQQNLQHSVW